MAPTPSLASEPEQSFKSMYRFFRNTTKKRPDMIPIIGLLFTGIVFGIYTGARTLMYSPDVVLDKSHHSEPWNDYRDKQYKWITTRDYTEPCPAPEYESK